MGFISEAALLKFALATAAIGIVLLLLVITLYAPTDLNEGMDVFIEETGSSLTISGSINKVQNFGNVTQISILVEVPVVVFSNISAQIDKIVLIQGKASDYQGERQVVASKITYIN